MTFLQPWFLLGSLLAAVPILIHLWFRKRLKKIPFSALRFLRSTEAQRFGWLRLREWLILLTRCLLVVFLFVGLARPHLKSTLFGMGRLASVCLIADNSYSMAYGDNFEQMKRMGRQVISRYSSNSEFCIIPLCAGRSETGNFWMSSKSALHALDNIEITYTDARIREAIERVPEIAPKHNIEYVYVGDGQVENFRDFPTRVASQGQFIWVHVPAGGNISISDVQLKDPVAVPLQNYTLGVVLKSHSPRTWSGKMGISSGDYYLENEYVLNPHAEAVLDLEIPMEYVRGKVQIFDDSLLPDNIYYFNKQLPQNIKVLLIGDSLYYLLALRSESGRDMPFEIKTTSTIGNADLRRYDVVILSGVREISNSERLRLDDFLSRPGTGLVVNLGDSTGENLNNVLSEICIIQENVLPKGYVIVDWVDTSHRIFSIFEDEQVMREVQFYQYTKVTARDGVLSRFSTGDPFVIVRGNKVVITGRMLPQYTDFVYKSSFVPVILRLLVNFTTDASRRELHVGDDVAPFRSVRTPTGDLLESGDRFKIPGFHVHDGETLCVNVGYAEGNLHSLGAERTAVLNIRKVDPETDLAGSDLSALFLILALLALVVELGLILLR
ncbi:MAG: BatA domain-containing protein [candidate division WOR-3 bacterium]|nr:MAG: BatA domain-containing protein [candidate division WOR-3 bacterium]